MTAETIALRLDQYDVLPRDVFQGGDKELTEVALASEWGNTDHGQSLLNW